MLFKIQKIQLVRHLRDAFIVLIATLASNGFVYAQSLECAAYRSGAEQLFVKLEGVNTPDRSKFLSGTDAGTAIDASRVTRITSQTIITPQPASTLPDPMPSFVEPTTPTFRIAFSTTLTATTTTIQYKDTSPIIDLSADCRQNTTADRDSDGIIDADDPRPFVDTPAVIQTRIIAPIHRHFDIFRSTTTGEADFASYYQFQIEVISNEPIATGFFFLQDMPLRHINTDGTSETFVHFRKFTRLFDVGRNLLSGSPSYVPLARSNPILLDVGGIFKGRSRTVKGVTLVRPRNSDLSKTLIDRTGNAPLDVYGNLIPFDEPITPLDYKDGQAVAAVPPAEPFVCAAINRNGQNKLYLAIDTTKINSFSAVNRAGFTVEGNTIASSLVALIDSIGYDYAGAAITLNAAVNTTQTVRYQHGSYSVDASCVPSDNADWDLDGVPDSEDFSSFSNANPFVATSPTVVVETLGPAVETTRTAANIRYQAAFRLKTDEPPFYIFDGVASNNNFDLGEVYFSGATPQTVTGISVETTRTSSTETEVLIKNIVVSRSRLSEIKGFTLLQKGLADKRNELQKRRTLLDRNSPIDINGDPVVAGAPFTPLDYNDEQAVALRSPVVLDCAAIDSNGQNKLYLQLNTTQTEITAPTLASNLSIAAADGTEKQVTTESVALISEVENGWVRFAITLNAKVRTTQTVHYRHPTQSNVLSATCAVDADPDWDGDGIPDSEDFSEINNDNLFVDKSPVVVVRAVRPHDFNSGVVISEGEYGLIYVANNGDWHFSFEVTASEPLPNLLNRDSYYLTWVNASQLREIIGIKPRAVVAVAGQKNTARLDFFLSFAETDRTADRNGRGYTVGLQTVTRRRNDNVAFQALEDRSGNVATLSHGISLLSGNVSGTRTSSALNTASEAYLKNLLSFALREHPPLTCARYAAGAERLFVRVFIHGADEAVDTSQFSVGQPGATLTAVATSTVALISTATGIAIYTIEVSSLSTTSIQVRYNASGNPEVTCYQGDTEDNDGDRIPDAVDPRPFTDTIPIIEVSVPEPISTIYKLTTNNETETFEIAHQVQFEISSNEPASEEFFIAAGRALLHISTGNTLTEPFMHRLRDIEYYDTEGNRINSGEDGLIVRGKISLALLDRGGLFKGRSSTVTGLTLARHPDLVDTAGNVPHDINNNPIPLNMPLTPLDYKNGQAVAAVPPAEPLVCTAINRNGQNKLYVAIDTAKIDSFTALNRAGFTVGGNTVASQSVVPINGIGYSYVGAAITLGAAVNTAQTVRYQHSPSYSVSASCVLSDHADWDEDGVPDIDDVSSFSDANPLVATSPTVVVEALGTAVEISRSATNIRYQATFRLTTDEPPYYRFSGAASDNNFDLGEVYFSGSTPQKVNGISVETMRASSTQIEVLIKNIVVASSRLQEIKGFTLLQATGRDSSNRQRELSDRVNAYPRNGAENQRNLPIDINGNPIARGSPFTPLDYNGEQAVALRSPVVLDCAAIDSKGQNKLYLQLNTTQTEITAPTLVSNLSIAAADGTEKQVTTESVALIGEVENGWVRFAITSNAKVRTTQTVHYRHPTQSNALSATCAVDVDADWDSDGIPDSEDFSEINGDNPFVDELPVVVVRAVRPHDFNSGMVISEGKYGLIYAANNGDWYFSFEVTASEPLPNLLDQDSYYLASVNASQLREVIALKPRTVVAIAGRKNTARLDFFLPRNAFSDRDGSGYTVGLQTVTRIRSRGNVPFKALEDRTGNVATLSHGISLLSGNVSETRTSSALNTGSNVYRKNILSFALRERPPLTCARYAVGAERLFVRVSIGEAVDTSQFSVGQLGTTLTAVATSTVALISTATGIAIYTIEVSSLSTTSIQVRYNASGNPEVTCYRGNTEDSDGDGIPDYEDFSEINGDNPFVDKSPVVVVRAVRPTFRGAEYGLVYVDDSGDWHLSFEATASEPVENLLNRNNYYLAYVTASQLVQIIGFKPSTVTAVGVAGKKNTARLDFIIPSSDSANQGGIGYTVGLQWDQLGTQSGDELIDRTGNAPSLNNGFPLINPFEGTFRSGEHTSSEPNAGSDVYRQNILSFALRERPPLICARYATGADRLFIAFSTTETIVATTPRFVVSFRDDDGVPMAQMRKPVLVSNTPDIAVYTIEVPSGGRDDSTLIVSYLEANNATTKHQVTCYQDDAIDYDGNGIPDAVDPRPLTLPTIEVTVSEPVSTIYKRTTNNETEAFEIAHQVQFEISSNEPVSEEFFIAAGRALLHISTGNALAGPFMHRLRGTEYYDVEGNRVSSGEDTPIVRGKISLILLDRGGLFKGRSNTVTGLTLAWHQDLVDTASNTLFDVNSNPIPLNMPITPLDYKNGQAVAAVPPAEPLVCTAINRNGQNKLYVAIDTAKIDSFTALNRAGFTVGGNTVASQSVVPINGIGYSYVGAAITLGAAVNTAQTVRYQHNLSYSVSASCVLSDHADWDEDGVPDVEDVSSFSDANPLVATSPTVVVEALSPAVEVAKTEANIEYQASFRLTTDEPPYYRFSGVASSNNFDLGEVYFSGSTPQKINGISVETVRASSTQIEVLIKNIVVASSRLREIKGFTLLQATGRDSSNRQRELSDRVNAYPRNGAENQRNLPIDINGNPIARGAPFTPLDYNDEQAVALRSPVVLDCAAIDSNGQNKLYLQLNTKQAKITTPTVAGFSVAAVGGVEKPVPAESVALIGEVENDLMRAVITLEAVVSAAQFVHYRHTTQSAVLSAICAVDADDDRDGDQVPDSEDFSAINNDNPFVATSPVVVVRAVRPTTAGGVIPDSDYGFIYGDDDSDWYLSFEVTASEPLPNLLNQDSYYLAFVNESKLREMIGFKPTAAIAVVGKRHTARLDFFIPTSAAVARDGIGYTVGLQSVTRTTGTVSFAALVDRSGNVAQLNHGIPLLSGNRTTAAESSALTTVSAAYRKNISAFARRGSPSLRVRLKVFLEGALQ